MGDKQLRVVPVSKAELDLSKLAQALLVMVAHLSSEPDMAPEDDHDGGA